MTRQTHNQFAKQYLKKLLSPFGKLFSEVAISREATGAVIQIDIYFLPVLQPPISELNLGILNQILWSDCLIEIFRTEPTFNQVRYCLLKLFSLQSKLEEEAIRTQEYLNEEDIRNQEYFNEINSPCLWILTTSASEKLMNGFDFHLDPENPVTGVYFSPAAFTTNLIVINQLPVIPETLWLRILGKGKTQESAILELADLSPENPLKNLALEQISIWKTNL